MRQLVLQTVTAYMAFLHLLHVNLDIALRSTIIAAHQLAMENHHAAEP